MRYQKILHTLYHRETYVPLSFLCDLFHVSNRTMINDLKQLNQDGIHHGFQIKLKRNEGYYLEVNDDSAFCDYAQFDDQMKIYTATERVNYILAIILLNNCFITQEYLANTLDVSKSMIKADMVKVKELLMHHHIMLEKKAHYGVRVLTRSLHRKQYIQELYESENEVIIKEIDSICGTQFKEIEKLLISQLKEYHFSCNYNELKKMDAFLKITIYTHKHSLYEEHPLLESKDNYYAMAKVLSKQIEILYDIQLLDSEVHDLGFYIKTKTKNKEHSIIYDVELKEEIHSFLMKADKEYHTKFNEDEQFKQSLLAHVSLLIDRLHQSITFTNPLVKEISVKYPVIFNMAIQFTERLKKCYQVEITQDEIGFIATHFAAHMEKEARDKLSRFNKIAILCSSGGGSAFLIKLKMETIFPSSMIQTFSLVDLEEIRMFQPDIIFTIIDLEESFDVPIIKIKELLDDSDMIKIKNMFGLASHDLTVNIADSLFRKEYFTIIEQPEDYLKLLENMANQIEQQGFAQNGYCDYVLKREQFLTTIYQNGVAIPHPMNMCGIIDVINVAIVKSPMEYDGHTAKVVFMVSLRKSSMELHQQITRVLFDVLSNDKIVNRLMKVTSFEEFMIQITEMNW